MSAERPIRVLHLLEHLRVGGAERVVRDLVLRLNEFHVHSIVCLYRKEGTLAEELKKRGVRVILLRKDPVSSLAPSGLKIVFLPVIVVESAIFVTRLSRLMRKERVDILHAHMFSANFWGKISTFFASHAACIATVHTKREKERSVKRMLGTYVLRRSYDRVVAVSQNVATSLKGVIPAAKLSVIHNGVSTRSAGEVAAARRRARRGRQGEETIVVAVGRLAPEKRYDLLLEALGRCIARLPGVKCWIVGDGPERKRLEGRARVMGLEGRVTFWGERDDVPALLAGADIMVNSSAREGLSLALLEGMSSLVPVVATDVGGTREIVRNGETGVLVRSGSAEELADGVLRLAANPAEAAGLADRAFREVVKHYSLEASVRKWERLYHEVRRGKRQGGEGQRERPPAGGPAP